MTRIVYKDVEETVIVPEHYNSYFNPPRKLEYTCKKKDFFISNENDLDFDKKILFLGDSTVECQLVEPRERLCSQLDRLLVSEGFYYSVLNGGMGRNSSLHSLLKFIAISNIVKPSVLILMSTIIDCESLVKSDNFWSPTWLLTPMDPPLESSIDSNAVNSLAGLDQRHKILYMFRDFCRLQNIKFVTVTVPLKYDVELPENYLYISPSELSLAHRMKIVNEDHQLFCDVNNINVIDIASKWKDLNWHELIYDDTHFSEAGAKVVAEKIFEELKNILVK